ncbi:AAA family ATPase [Streptomyces ossamyceticus]|uniref:AAA family ATPase n=1 Tax=Streptomyces ossamyceticus TaxID=249581 RepID=A0ABV2VA76_9ACTN
MGIIRPSSGRSAVLLRFRVANHRSIRDECELSLVAAEHEGTARSTGLREDGLDIGVEPVVGVFGANASGKSNLLSAMRYMRRAVRESFAEWTKLPDVPREPFKLDPGALDETSLFEVDLALGAKRTTRYTYGFELSDERVEAEWLYAYPDGKRVVWFDREADRPLREGGEFVFDESDIGFRGRRDDLVAFTRPNALFLSTAAALNDPQLSAVHRWFLDNLWLVTPGEDVAARTEWTRRLLMDARAASRDPDAHLDKDARAARAVSRNKDTHLGNDPRARSAASAKKGTGDYPERLAQLLAIADLGLTGVDIDRETGEVTLRHRTPDGGEAPLDFRTEESLGTHSWFAFLGPVLHVLDSGSTLLVDELDSSLHPTLAAEVVRLFQDPRANPRDAQLIFTTHDATLLGSEVLDTPLDRNQVWITAKRRSGQTELYRLTDAGPGPGENLERGYLRGRYGGVPRVGAGEIAREVSWQEEQWQREREAKATA